MSRMVMAPRMPTMEMSIADTNEDATGEPNNDGSADRVWHSDDDKPIELTEISEEKGGTDADSVEPADSA